MDGHLSPRVSIFPSSSPSRKWWNRHLLSSKPKTKLCQRHLLYILSRFSWCYRIQKAARLSSHVLFSANNVCLYWLYSAGTLVLIIRFILYDNLCKCYLTTSHQKSNSPHGRKIRRVNHAWNIWWKMLPILTKLAIISRVVV